MPVRLEPSVSSRALYHWATALPNSSEQQKFAYLIQMIYNEEGWLILPPGKQKWVDKLAKFRPAHEMNVLNYKMQHKVHL